MRLDPAGWPFVIVLAAATVAAAWIHPALAAVPGAALVFTAWFFRDPDRRPPAEIGAILSPADGRIIRADARVVSIFMNVFDVHVCRSPAAGRVVSVTRHRGAFLAAFRDDASERNERTEIVVDPGGAPQRFTLVAGLVARRIVCRVAPGLDLRAGDRVGVIRFGSRVDVELPTGAEVGVTVGDRVTAGETVLARRRPDA